VAPAPVQLTSLPDGSVGRLHDTNLDDDTRSLLRSLGLTDASRLRVCKSGEPFIIQVRATRIGVSSAVARGIFVIPEAEARDHAGHRARR
jgi:Fe2+ transport system protein FeoA